MPTVLGRVTPPIRGRRMHHTWLNDTSFVRRVTSQGNRRRRLRYGSFETAWRDSCPSGVPTATASRRDADMDGNTASARSAPAIRCRRGRYQSVSHPSRDRAATDLRGGETVFRITVANPCVVAFWPVCDPAPELFVHPDRDTKELAHDLGCAACSGAIHRSSTRDIPCPSGRGSRISTVSNGVSPHIRWRCLDSGLGEA